MAPAFLSKSRYLNGMQCLRYLWLVVNDPDKVPAPDAQTKHLFDQGHLVQQYAEKLFPGGVRMPESTFKQSVQLTTRLLTQGQPFFEAGILADDVYSRIDVFRPADGGLWDIIEVKSSTRVKDENVHDVSFQKFCCDRRRIGINRCYLMHINNRYVKQRDIDPNGLFTIEDVSDGVAEVSKGIEARVHAMIEAMASKVCPDSRVGPHCSDPYDCPVTLCREALPENNVLELYRGSSKAFGLLNEGIRFLREIPDSVKLTEAQLRQKWCDSNSCAYVDTSAIAAFVKSLKYPVHYLDFETFSTAVPLLDGTRPYQQVPFQFSLHVVDKPGAMAWPAGYLAEGPADPRPRFFEELRKAIGDKGSIVVYNQKFEEGIIQDLGKAFPEYGEWVSRVIPRMVDLLDPFRNFSYYHPAQKGSASIKSVMPSLTGRGYDDLEISIGDQASLAYLDMTYGEMPADQKAKTRIALQEYCGRDTLGMIWIVEKLRELSSA